ncbi:MAG: 30S ribosomal protein S17 [Planctomycetota bacterium]
MSEHTTNTATAGDKAKGARVGEVTSAARDKTIKVVVSYVARHPKYGKYVRRRTVLHAHDEDNAARVGDRVEVVPCRPMSKTKSWRLSRVVRQQPAD